MNWLKKGQIFDPTKFKDKIDRPWMKEFSQCVSTLELDDVVRVFFSCRPFNKNNKATSYTTFLDLDKENLTKIIKVHDKPILDLGKKGCFDEHAVYPSCVIKHENNILFYYAGWYRCESVPFNCSIGVAISSDGENFTRLGDGPILSTSLNEPFVISGPKVRKFNNKFYMFYLSGTKWIMDKNRPEVVYKIRLATSNDGFCWEKQNISIIEDLLEENECQAGPDVFYYNNLYHMYFVYRYALNFRNNSKRGYRIGYATSKDLINWERKDNISGIKYSSEGWDSTMMHYPHVFLLNQKFYMLYNGNEFGKYGFGLAELSD